MPKEINDLPPVLLAISRQIAEQKATSCRSDRPERDLSILLIPHSGHPLTGSATRQDAALPYLLGAGADGQGDAAQPAPVQPEGLTPPPQPVFPVLRPGLLGGRA